jgi:hypothetical protein
MTAAIAGRAAGIGQVIEDPATAQAVSELPAGELALALYVSDWPHLQARPSPAQVAYWAGQGLVRLRPGPLRQAAARVRRFGTAAAFPGRPLQARRWQACADAAGWYLADRAR